MKSGFLPPSLGSGLEWLEAERFVGRRFELDAIEELWRSPVGGVIFIHGSAGVGKSALLGAALRRAQAAGRTALRRSAGERSPRDRALVEVRGAARPLLAIDGVDQDPEVQAWLMEALPVLPSGSVLLLASRRPLPPSWLAGVLGSGIRTIDLEPLSEADSRALLAGHGLEGQAADPAIEWAAGWPAALVLAAAGKGVLPQPSAIVARLAGEEIEAVSPEVLTLAALLRNVDQRSMEVLSEAVERRSALAELERLSVVERGSGGLELHPLLRRSLREALRERSPERERELRRRLADHLHLRACRGEGWLLLDLAELIEDPAVRWGFAAGGGGELRAGALGAEELAQFERAVKRRWDAEWWEGTKRWLVEAPESVVVVRGGAGELKGFCVATSLARLPAWAGADPVLGAWIAHAEAAAPLGDAILWRDVLALDEDRDNRVRALLNATAALRSGVSNPRWFYGPVDPANGREVALATAVGARHISELDVRLDSRLLQCHVIDHGPGGLLGLTRDLVYRDLGIPPRRPPSAEQVHAALRALRSGGDLAGSPFTSEGLGRAEQRREVRARLSVAAEETFGSEQEERLLRAVLDYAYLEESADPREGPAALSVSRATFYRRLRVATERLVGHLAEER